MQQPNQKPPQQKSPGFNLNQAIPTPGVCGPGQFNAAVSDIQTEGRPMTFGEIKNQIATNNANALKK
jgi:hypothetical protein